MIILLKFNDYSQIFKYYFKNKNFYHYLVYITYITLFLLEAIIRYMYHVYKYLYDLRL